MTKPCNGSGALIDSITPVFFDMQRSAR